MLLHGQRNVSKMTKPISEWPSSPWAWKVPMIRLSQIAVRTPVKLLGLNFVEMFAWLSRSTQAVAHAAVDGEVALPPPGWGAV